MRTISIHRVHVLLAMAFVATCLAAGISYNAPDGILIQGNNYNAGVVKLGQKISYQMRAVNVSAHMISLTTLPTCGCTSTQLSGAQIAPLRTATIAIQVDTQGMAKGKQKRMVLCVFHAINQTWMQKIWVHFQVT